MRLRAMSSPRGLQGNNIYNAGFFQRHGCAQSGVGVAEMVMKFHYDHQRRARLRGPTDHLSSFDIHIRRLIYGKQVRSSLEETG
jgi:hypothetical protein